MQHVARQARQALTGVGHRGLSVFETRVASPVDRAAGLAADVLEGGVEEGSFTVMPISEEELLESAPAPQPQKVKTLGVFQQLPQVSPAVEIIGTALKRAERVPYNKKLKNEAARTKNRVARQLDTLTKEVAMPLGRYMRGFPAPASLHPFERALLELTVGEERYLRTLARVDVLRKAALEVGKSNAARANKAPGKKEALQVQQEGFEAVARVYERGATAVDSLKEIAKQLRRLPVVDVCNRTIALVGAPNVGKSSLVQVISSGTPEVCNYPFTTRNIKMGHFYVDSRRHQVTDTPGLLDRPDQERNAMERLTLACLAHLPTSVLFVMDLTGECGMRVHHQWAVRQQLRRMFPDKPWLDVFSKADLLEEEFDEAQQRLQAYESAATASPSAAGDTSSSSSASSSGENGSIGASLGAGGSDAAGTAGAAGDVAASAVDVAVLLPKAVRVSSLTGSGMEELKGGILDLMAQQQAAVAEQGTG